MVKSRSALRWLFSLGRIKHLVFKKASLSAQAAELAASFNRSGKIASTSSLSVIVTFESARENAFRASVRSLMDDTELELIVAARKAETGQAEVALGGGGWKGAFSIIAVENLMCPIQAIRAARQDVLTVLQSGDIFTPNALGIIRRVLSDNVGISLLYTDSLNCDEESGETVWCAKPAFDPVLFGEVDYISRAAFFRRDHLVSASRSVGRSVEQGTMKDFFVAYMRELEETSVLHLPFPAFQTSTAKRESVRIDSTETVRADSLAESSWPMISIIIPSRNGLDLVRQTLEGLFCKTDYPNFEVIVIDNGSDDPKVLDLYQAYRTAHGNFSAHVESEPFNFSRSINKGMALAKAEDVLLLNNDIEVIEPGWLKELVSCLDFENAGIVGAKLLYPDNTIQHAGVIVGLNGMASHWHYKEEKNAFGPMGRLSARNSMTCVTGAVMLISGACRKVLGDWDEKNFAVAYNDVDYCLRAHGAGFRIIWTPHATLYHHESVTRGKDRSRTRKRQFQREKAALKRIHHTMTFEDPAFNPWYVRRPGELKLRCPRVMPKPRLWWD